jgi:hypothetical protein
MIGQGKLSLSLRAMNSTPSPAVGKPLVFPDWPAQLAGDASLSPGVQESYRVTLTRFLAFCRQRRAAATVGAAREFVELARLEAAPSAGRVQEWKEALR